MFVFYIGIKFSSFHFIDGFESKKLNYPPTNSSSLNDKTWKLQVGLDGFIGTLGQQAPHAKLGTNKKVT